MFSRSAVPQCSLFASCEITCCLLTHHIKAFLLKKPRAKAMNEFLGVEEKSGMYSHIVIAHVVGKMVIADVENNTGPQRNICSSARFGGQVCYDG